MELREMADNAYALYREAAKLNLLLAQYRTNPPDFREVTGNPINPALIEKSLRIIETRALNIRTLL